MERNPWQEFRLGEEERERGERKTDGGKGKRKGKRWEGRLVSLASISQWATSSKYVIIHSELVAAMHIYSVLL